MDKIRKKGLEVSFAWLFAIIVGVIILFLAIYAVTKFIGTEREISDAEISKEIEVLINPLQTEFETAKTTSLTLPVESRIYNGCNDLGNFGKQFIKVSQKSFGEWTDTNQDSESYNKYIFSKNYTEGKTFYLFSKPFELPFKAGSLVYLTSSEDEYCFVNPPTKIKEEISNLKQKNLLLECSQKSVKVCFSDGANCDLIVSESGKYIEKNNEKIYFEGDALMYAGIFSEKEIYECQLKRLMKRIGKLADLYVGKERIISGVCDAKLGNDLLVLKNLAENLGSSEELYKLNNLADDIQGKNSRGRCGLW